MVFSHMLGWFILHLAALASAAYLDQDVLTTRPESSVLRRFTAQSESSDVGGWNVHDILAAAQVRIGQ